MTQEDKDLLLTDLCARLKHGVKIQTPADCWTSEKVICELKEIFKGDDGLFRIGDVGSLIEYSKPYLFPLSSMTEEQKKEISKRYNYHNYYGLYIEITNHSEGYWDDDTSCNLQDYLWLEDWYNKNHFDYRGLIEKELAIDATNKNIY